MCGSVCSCLCLGCTSESFSCQTLRLISRRVGNMPPTKTAISRMSVAALSSHLRDAGLDSHGDTAVLRARLVTHYYSIPNEPLSSIVSASGCLEID